MAASIEIHKDKGLQLSLRALFLRGDSTTLLLRLARGTDVLLSTEPQMLVQQMREECRADEQYTIDQLYGIVDMLNTLWQKSDLHSDQLEYSSTPTIYNALLHFVDKGTLAIKDNTYVVCRGKDILRWHTLSSDLGEDLLVCAFLASYDQRNVLSTKTRNDFAWPCYIRTNDAILENMLEMPLADIHAHLKGSSLNFDINWICLMNHIDGREDSFKKMARFLQGDNHQRIDANTLYSKAVVAAAIRLYLAQLTTSNPVYSMKELKGVCQAFKNGSTLNVVNALQQYIETALATYGKLYEDDETGESSRFDYAIRNGKTVPRGKQEMCAYSLLSGERHILYSALMGIYKGDYSEGPVQSLLYAYLLVKNEIRHELSQLNDSVGFENFSIYEDRKLIFAKPHSAYKKAAIHLAVASFFGEHSDGSRYHETRITPENNDGRKAVDKNIDEIDFNDGAIGDRMFRTHYDGEHTPWTYRYIYHFIKSKDDTEEIEFSVVPRHHRLREKVKEEALGIYELRNSLRQNNRGEYYADRVVGIDAANSEIACRPEVFAQAFRFLRRHQIVHKHIHCPADLGITYHVGEDFMDVVDGLRAVDEAIQFLQLQKGDRIGHGLVLGVDVNEYYKIRNHTVAMSLQMQMDNAAWLWNCLNRMGKFVKCKGEMARRFGICFRRVYPHYGKTPNVDLYYSSMLLRGDNPGCYDARGKVSNPYDRVTGWGNKALVRSKDCDEARKQREVCRLYHLYHYDKDGKINGRVFDKWAVDEDMCQAIAAVQKTLLQQVENLGIAIECNPTSNFKIGEIDRYDSHPITTFNSFNHNNIQARRCISVSINTDDKGVLSTSIEREYALIAHALIRKYRREGDRIKDSDVYDWLDKIRLQSLQQRFDKTIQLHDHPERKTLDDLKKHVGKEYEAEIRGKKFFDRLKWGINILFGKNDGKI